MLKQERVDISKRRRKRPSWSLEVAARVVQGTDM